MRVTFNHSELQETHGLFRKTHTTYYVVTCTVTLNEEERAIIRRRNLSDFAIMDYDLNANQIDHLQRNPKDAQYLNSDHQTAKIKDLLGEYDKHGKLVPGDGHIRKVCYTPVDAKNFEHELIVALKRTKEFLEDNKETETTKTFEL